MLRKEKEKIFRGTFVNGILMDSPGYMEDHNRGRTLSARARRGTGLGLRGTQVTIHEHFNGTKNLYWRTRKLAFKVMEKPLRQADGGRNARVDEVLGLRSTAHTPMPDHSWRNHPPVAS